MENIFEGKRVMHIDTSCKIYENKDTAIAYKIIESKIHKGLVITRKIKKGLIKGLGVKNFAKIYAIAIYYLIREDLELFDILVICGDEKFSDVKNFLGILFNGNKIYSEKQVISIGELRIITANKKLTSYADKISGSYRRRGLKSLKRRQEGVNLNPLKITFKMISDKLYEIEDYKV
jgi:hypothetical protein